MQASATLPTIQREAPAPSLSFFGLVRGEFFKIIRLRITWAGVVIAIGPLILYMLTLALVPSIKTGVQSQPATVIPIQIEREMTIIRIFIGFLVTILTIMVMGLDYQQGTIRIILARGVGRLQLLGAKLLTIFGVAFAILAAYLLIAFVGSYFIMGNAAGDYGIFGKVSGNFGNVMLLYILTIVISISATILMATAATLIGRSVAFGMAVGLLFLPADTIFTIVAQLIYLFTNSDFWLKITAYLLGPSFNILPANIVPSTALTVTRDGVTQTLQRPAETFPFTPLVHYDAAHTLTVIALYSLAFIAISAVLVWRRDVKE